MKNILVYLFALSFTSCKIFVAPNGLKKEVFEKVNIETEDSLYTVKSNGVTRKHVETNVVYTYNDMILFDKIIWDVPSYNPNRKYFHIYLLRKADTSQVFKIPVFRSKFDSKKIDENIEDLYERKALRKINNFSEVSDLSNYIYDFADTTKFRLRILKQNKRKVIANAFFIDSENIVSGAFVVQWQKKCKQNIFNSRLDSFFGMKINKITYKDNHVYKHVHIIKNSYSDIDVKPFTRKERDKVIGFMNYADSAIFKK